MKLIEKIEKIIEELETSKIPIIYFILTFFFITTLRNFLEIFSDKAEISFNLFSHYDISYLYLVLMFIVLFHLFTKEKIEKISRVIIPCFLILILAVIIDLLISGGRGYDIGYMTPENNSFLLKFFTFFGSLKGSPISPGIRIEVALSILGSFIYFSIKKIDFIKSLLFSFLIYSLIFTYLAMPFVVKEFLELFNLKYIHSAPPMRNFYLLLIFILSIWLFYLYNKKYFLAILKDIRPFRLLHFESMFILGIVLGKIYFLKPVQLTENNLFSYLFTIIAILFAWLFSVTSNNIADYEIDKITNKKRPLISRAILKKDYTCLSWFFLISAIIYSAAVNFKISFLITLFIGNYFLYSMPPLRLKRITFFSKLLISLNSLILLMVGYMLATENLKIPTNIVIFFLFFLTAAINFIDIKDYQGDKKAGIKTFPVVFGLKKAKILIGLFFVLVYLTAFFVIKSLLPIPIYMLVLMFIFGCTQFFLINKKVYNEKYIFFVYLFSLIVIIYLSLKISL